MSTFRILLALFVLLLVIFTSSATPTNTNLVFIDPIVIGGVDDSLKSTGGEGSYQVSTEVYGSVSYLDFSFWNLEPDTYYVLWCMTLASDLHEELYSAPCKATDNSEIHLRSDANGSGALKTDMPALQSSNDVRVSIIALVNEHEGFTYGAPRDHIGIDRHIQALAILPD